MIRFEQVEKRYGSTCALRDVTLQIPPGVVHGFIGPNGAGKTTAMRLMAGLARPTRGRVTMPAVPIGYLPQRVEMNGLATARETVRLFACLRQLPLDSADRALECAGLQEHADRQVRVLSGGLRQRVGLAIACLGDPEILLLDEPSAGLDPRAAVELRRDIRRLAAGGRTVVVCSHSLPELESVCDRVTVLHGGRVVLDGALEDLRRGHAAASLDDLFMEATAASVND
jgi:ABC-type multidrug transport system ATPase subunit